MVMPIVATLIAVAGIVYVEPQHHRVVFVNRVVAVHGVAPDEVAEAEEQFDIVVLSQPHDILAAPLDCGRRVAVATDDLVFFEVNVNGVLPVKAALQVPLLRSVATDAEADLVAVEEFVVDHPLAVSTVELELTALINRRPRRHVVEVRVGRRVYASISDRVGNHSELKHLIALACGNDVVGRSRPITLLKAVFKPENGSSRERRKINYHIHSLGHGDAKV